MVTLDTTSTDSWQKSLDAQDFLKNFRKKVYKSDIPVYSPFYNDTIGARISVANIEIDLGKHSDKKSFTWGNYKTDAIGFIEKWHFDTTNVKFNKTTEWWYPGFFSNSDSSYHRVFHVFSGNTTEPLAENIIYEITFGDKSSDFRYLDYNRFFSWLVNSAINGKLQVFAPDSFNNKFDTETLKKRLGEQTVDVTDQDEKGNVVNSTAVQKFNLEELKGIIFIEDWYYDKKTGNFSKKVNGIAPVRYYEDADGNSLKSIPFVFFTGEKKCNIL